MKAVPNGFQRTILYILIASSVPAATLQGDPSNLQSLLPTLKPGDTLILAPGRYPPLNLSNLRGTAEDWISIQGSSTDPATVIQGVPGHNTIEIINCSYLAIENLVIDSRGIPGTFGISARGREFNQTHHIRIEGNTLIGQNGGQQTDGISTKTPTWGWVIRYNKIIGAGTGLYLGDSDSTQPFVAGIIENNFVTDTIGYSMEIKDQKSIPALPGMPLGPTSTIIRNNVFIKNDQPSPDGDRPNLIVGSFPGAGPGFDNIYEIYGNLFVHNHREALFQGSGRLSLHDNIFLDGPLTYPAVVLRKQNGLPLKVAMVYNNTIYTSGDGLEIASPALSGAMVAGNLIFAGIAAKGITAGDSIVSDNLIASLENAPAYVRAPSFDPTLADFYPIPGKCGGAPIDLSYFQSDNDYTIDFNGMPKTQSQGGVVFRGAYAGDGQNPGWKLGAALKAPAPPLPRKPRLVWAAATRAGAATTLTLTGANFAEGAEVHIAGTGIEVAAAELRSPTEIVATLKIARGIVAGTREVQIHTAAGDSNSFKVRFR
jgi:hypothetical protein